MTLVVTPVISSGATIQGSLTALSFSELYKTIHLLYLSLNVTIKGKTIKSPIIKPSSSLKYMFGLLDNSLS